MNPQSGALCPTSFFYRLNALGLLVAFIFCFGIGEAQAQPPTVANPGNQNVNEDATFLFNGPLIQIIAPNNPNMEAVVRILSGNATLSNGFVSSTQLASQGSLTGVNTFLSSLQFTPAANWNGTAVIEVATSSNFTNRPGNSTVFTFNIVVNPVNDTPVATGSATLGAVNEDTANPAGAAISGLFPGNFSDSIDQVTGGSSANTFAGIAIVGSSVNAAQGQWQYRIGAVWTNVGARSAASNLLLPATDSLRFLPAANYFGTPSALTVRLIDNSSGAVVFGAGPDLTSAFGGITPYSAATVALTTSIAPVNDAPVTVNGSFDVQKNQVATFTLVSTDVDSGTNASSDAIVNRYRIVTLPSNGTLRRSDNVVIGTANTVITAAQATNMTFTPAANYAGPASFNFRAIDQANAQSAIRTMSIDVTAFNEPPIVSIPGPVVIDEDSTLNLLGSASLADADAGSAIVRIVMAATNGTVTLSTVANLFDAEVAGNAITADPFTSLTFFGTIAAVNAALTDLRYTPNADYFGSADVSITASDLGNTGGAAKEDTEVIIITVTNVPDAPFTGPATLAAVNEDNLSPLGQRVSLLLSSYSDADGNPLAGLAISQNAANASTEGRWQFSLNGGVTWRNVGAVSGSDALLLPAIAELRFLPAANYFGTPGALQLHAVDTSGARVFTSNPSARISMNLGTDFGSDFDATGSLLTTEVLPVNDLFVVINDGSLVVDEGGNAVVTSAVLRITDAEAGPGDIVYTILGAGTNLTEGVFQFDSTGSGGWVDIGAGDTFTQAHINAGRLRYVHSGDEPTDPQVLAYSVTDFVAPTGGTTAQRTLNISISPVNDPPSLFVPGQIATGDLVPLVGDVPFGSTLSFSTSNIRVIDTDNIDQQLVFRLEALPTEGTLLLNGGPTGVGTIFSYADLGQLTYTHNGSPATTDGFTVSLRDGAGGIVGAVDGIPATPVNIPLAIVPPNTAPLINNTTFGILEWDQNVPFPLSISDADTASGGITVAILTLPTPGEAVLLFDGNPIVQAQLDAPGGFTFPADQVGLLRVNHTSPNRVNPGPFSFNISATDDNVSPLTTNATLTVLVRAVDDEPTLALATLDLVERFATGTFTASQITGEDVDTTDNRLLFRITSRPAHGYVTLDGVPLGVGGTFTQQDVIDGLLQYVHLGVSDAPDSFEITLRDQGFNIRYDRPGGVYPNTVSTTLLTQTVNITVQDAGPPLIDNGDTSTDPSEAGSFPILTVIDFLETDRNIAITESVSFFTANDGGITPFSITAVGSAVDGTVALIGSDITFTPDAGFVGIASFEYTLEDSADPARTTTGNVTVIVYDSNQAPNLQDNEPLILAEGGTATITSALLLVEDVDDPVADIFYVLTSLPSNGTLRVGAAALMLGDFFTQEDIDNGLLTFEHDGSEQFLSSFEFSFTDGAAPLQDGIFGIDVTPVNNQPAINTSPLIVLEGQDYILIPANISANDVDGVGSDKNTGFAAINTLTLSIAQVSHLPANGELQFLDGAVWMALAVGADFTPQQIADGEIRYLHDGSETITDAFTVTVNDNTGEPNATASAVVVVGIIPVNIDPTIVLNETLTLNEGATATITFASHLQSADPDNDDIEQQFRLTTVPLRGLLLNGTDVLSVGSKFTLADLKNGLISYRHDGSQSTVDSFNFTLSDGGGGNEPSDIFNIVLSPINNPPAIALPFPAQLAIEGEPAPIVGIIISDPDSVDPATLLSDPGFGPMSVTLTPDNGTVEVTAVGGATVTGNGTGVLTIQGTLGEINATLESLLYTSGDITGVTGAVVLNILVDDLGNTGAGGPLTASADLDITVFGVNRPPVVDVPVAQTVNEETSLIFSTGNVNLVSFSDSDIATGVGLATISVTNGTLTLGSLLDLGIVTGNGTNSVTFTGTRAAINAALEGLSYQGVLNYFGPDQLIVTVNDQGNTGTFDDPQADTRTVAITVNPVNDAPTVAPINISMNEEGTLTFNLASSDVDSGTDPVNDAVVTHYFINLFSDNLPTQSGFVGELRTSDNVLLSLSNSVAPIGFTGLNAGQHVITAAQAAGMTYQLPANYNSNLSFVGDDLRSRFDFRAIDILDVNLADSSKSGTARTTITVNPVNDAPVLAGGGDTVSFTEGSGLNQLGTSVVLNAAADITAFDIELTEQDEDDFNGSTVTVRRTGSAVTTDRFEVVAGAGVSLAGNNIEVDSATRAQITNNSSTGSLVITFNASATRLHVEAIMQRIGYNSVANNFQGSLTAQMVFNDGNSGAQGSGGALNSNALTFTVNVSDVNDAPGFTDNGLIAVAEESANPAGSTVLSIMGGAFADVDPSALPAGQFAGIAITNDAANQATEGRWQYSTNNGTDWFDVNPLVSPLNAPGAGNALLLDVNALLRFIPVTRFNDRGVYNFAGGQPTTAGAGGLSVVPVDGSTGRAFTSGASRLVADTVTGWNDTSDLGADAPALVNVNVTQVNNAPVISNLNTDNTFFEALGVNVAGPAVLLDDPTDPAELFDVDLTLRQETTFNGSRLVIRAGSETVSAVDPFDFFLPQISAGITLVGTFNEPGPGILLFDPGALILFDSQSVGVITDNSAASGQLVITFNSNASKAAVDALLQSITYSNNNPALPFGPKPITVFFFDGNATQPNNVQGTGGELRAAATVNINLIPRNDAPLLTQGGTITFNEETTSTSVSFGATLGGFFEDPDLLTPAAILNGVAISAFDNAGLGNWQVLLGSVWENMSTLDTNIGGIAAARAVIFSAATEFRFVPNANVNTAGTTTRPTLQVHAIESAIPADVATITAPLPSGLGQATSGLTGTVNYTASAATPVTFDTSVSGLDSIVAVVPVGIAARIIELNDAPVLAGTTFSGALVESPVVGEGTLRQQLLTAVSVTDLDLATTQTLDNTIFGAGSITVSIANAVVGDLFSVAGSPAGIASITGGSGVTSLSISLATTTTLAQINAILESIQFEHTTDIPPSGARDYSVVISDGDNLNAISITAGGPTALSSNTLTGSVTITGVNDIPHMVSTSLNPNVIEDAATPVLVFGSTSTDSTFDPQRIIQLQLTISNLQNGENELFTMDGSEFPLLNGWSEFTITNGGFVQVSVAGNTATLIFDGFGLLTNAQTNVLVNSLAYRNTSDFPLGANRVVTITLLQDDGGTDNGGIDTNTDLTQGPSNVASSTITLELRNDAPVLAATLVSPTTTENAGFGSGTNGVPLFSGSSATDIDFVNASLGGGNVRVTLDAYFPGDGIFIPNNTPIAVNAIRSQGSNIEFSADGLAWTVIGSVDATANGNATGLTINLNANANEENLVFLLNDFRFANSSDNPTVFGTAMTRSYNLVVNDGNNNGLAGGPTALDSNVLSGGTINISAVNDPPVLAGPVGPLDLFENNVSNGSTFAFTGVNTLSVTDIDGETIFVLVTAAHGTLNVDLTGGAAIDSGANGSATFTLFGTLAEVNDALASIILTPPAHYNGPSSITLLATDTGTPGPGELTDELVVPLNILPVNSAPLGTDNTITATNFDAYPFAALDFGFSDPNDSPENAFGRVLITTVPDFGTLRLNGLPITAGTYVDIADIISGLFTYTNPPDEQGLGVTSFTFQVEDDGGLANGGSNLDPVPKTMNLNLRLDQEICFDAPALVSSNQPLLLDAYSTSGLRVSYAVTTNPGGIGSITGETLTFSGPGTVSITATQVGDGTYFAASPVEVFIEAINFDVPRGLAQGWTSELGGGLRSEARAVALQLSGNVATHIAATGFTTNLAGHRDLIVAKYAANGTKVWDVVYNHASGNDEGVAVAIDSVGNVIVAGNVTNASGNTDIFVAKYAAANGTLLWSATHAGNANSADGVGRFGTLDVPNRVFKGRENLKVGPADEIIVGGFVTNTATNQDLVVLKYASTGTPVWATTYDNISSQDFANAVEVDAAGNVYAAGGSRGTHPTTGAVTADAVTLRLHPVDGSSVWVSRFEGINPDEANSMRLDGSGNPVISGFSQQTTFDFFVVRYDAASGDELWSRLADGSPGSSDTAWDMAVIPGDKVILTGASYPFNGVFDSGTIHFRGCDLPFEPLRWFQRYNGPATLQDQHRAMGTDIFGNPIVAGYSKNADGSHDAYIAKYDAHNGALYWDTRSSSQGTTGTEAYAIAVDPSGNAYVVGSSTPTAAGATQFWVTQFTTNPNANTSQTITFANPGVQTVGTPLVLAATSDSGLPVQYHLVEGMATLDGNVLTFEQAGTVTVRATQPGNFAFAPAPPVEQTFNVVRGLQSIAFTLPAEISYAATLSLNGYSTSGLPVFYQVLSGPGVVNNGILSFTGPGTVEVEAFRPRNQGFEAFAGSITATTEAVNTPPVMVFGNIGEAWVQKFAGTGNGVAKAVAIHEVPDAFGDPETQGIYVTGYTTTGTGRDILTRKYAPAGSLAWSVAHSGTGNATDEGNAVVVDAQGNAYVAGVVTVAGQGANVYVAKYSSANGTRLWDYTFNGTGNGADTPVAIALHGTHVIIGGTTAGSGAGTNFLAIKLAQNSGAEIWTASINSSGARNDAVTAMAVVSDGGVVLGGSAQGTNQTPAGALDAWTVKLNPAGAFVWERRFDGPAKQDAVRGLAVDLNDDVFITAYTQAANYDIYTAKYRAHSGEIIWEQIFNGEFNSSDASWALTLDQNGDVIVAGASYRSESARDGYTLKYSSLTGQQLWGVRFNGTSGLNDEHLAVGMDGLGNPIVTGYTRKTTGADDIYTAKYNRSTGTIIWQREFGGIALRNDRPASIATDAQGNAFIGGSETNSANTTEFLIFRYQPQP